MCSWCEWENPARGRSAAYAVTRLAESPPCCKKPEGWIFPSTPGTHDKTLFLAYFISFNSMRP